MQVHANIFPQVIFAEGPALATPAAGTVVVYAKADGLLYSKDDAGVETALGADLTTVLAMLRAAVTHNFGSDANYVLDDTDAASSVFIATDTGPALTTARDLVFPPLFSPKLFKNSTAQTLTVKKSGQPGTAIAAGDSALVFSGASDVLVFAGSGGAFVGGSLTTPLNEAQGANIASATTTDIGAATGNLVHITGTTTITGLGVIQAGTERVLVFDGILTLTHNAVSLILPTGANITTAAGDVAIMRSEGGGNWRCISYTRASGAALSAPAVPASLGVHYQADVSATTDADPGAGKLRWNHATQASATVLFLDDVTDGAGATLTGIWAALLSGGFIYLQHATDANIWSINHVTNVVDAAGYAKLTITRLSGDGSFAAADPIRVVLEQGAAAAGVTTVNGASGTPLVLVPFAIAFSDETTAITAGTNKARWINPSSKAFNVVEVAASLNVAQASGSIFTLDINEAGVSILSTKLTIDNGETVGGSHASAGSATPAVISDASIAGFAQVSVDVDQVGSGSAAGGKVYLIGYWTV